MKRIFITLILLVAVCAVQAQKISYIETTRSWHYVYDENGKKVHTISTSQGEASRKDIAHGGSLYGFFNTYLLKEYAEDIFPIQLCFAAHGKVALGIQVDRKYFLALLYKSCGYSQGSGGLGDAAFFIDDTNLNQPNHSNHSMNFSNVHNSVYCIIE